MKLYIKFIALIITITNLLLLCSCKNNTSVINELGNPTKKYYIDNFTARCIWDMEIFDGKLYIGNGDFDSNSGPTPVLYCNLDSLGDWKKEAMLSDEQIGRFLTVNGRLAIPGFDPRGNPKTGTYYQLENGVWNTYHCFANSLHNFDLIEIDGKLFAGIGAPKGQTSIMMSENGQDFINVAMYKNGQPISTSDNEYTRTYNFFIFKNTLYATLYYKTPSTKKGVIELYRYENGIFTFDNAWGKKLTFVGCKYLAPIRAKTVINDTLFISTGYLHYTTNMNEFKIIELPNNAQTYDLYVHDNVLYILAAFQTDGGYRTTIYSTTSENVDDFKCEIKFDYPVPPTSFALNDDSFFIAMGDCNTESEQNGTVIQIERK